MQSAESASYNIDSSTQKFRRNSWEVTELAAILIAATSMPIKKLLTSNVRVVAGKQAAGNVCREIVCTDNGVCQLASYL
jgi:hypothetical protein